MSAERQFPIMGYWRGRQRGEPFYIPWDFIAPHDAQAKLNHNQDLEKLARRGGLGPEEALDILRGQSFSSSFSLTWEQAATEVRKLEQEWQSKRVKA